MQELYDLFFGGFFIEVGADPDILVELPEGAVAMGADPANQVIFTYLLYLLYLFSSFFFIVVQPAHQVILQVRDVRHRQLQDLLLIYSMVSLTFNGVIPFL